jgi:hypothetical protein
LYSDDRSIDDDLFDGATTELSTRKPLLTAAYKAREERRAEAFRGNGLNHLQFAHQPHLRDDDDVMSLGLSDVFESSGRQAYSAPPKKPLLQAAMKAKEARDAAENAREGEVLRSSHKSRYRKGKGTKGTFVDDSVSLTMSDIFDPPKGERPSKPLLTAALKAKEEQSMKNRGGNVGAMQHSSTNKDPLPPPIVKRRHTSTNMSASLVRKNSLEIKNMSSHNLPSSPPPKTQTTKQSKKISGKESESNSPSDVCTKSKKNKKTTTKSTSGPTSDSTNQAKKSPRLFGRRGSKKAS